ncbi:MAG TPA: hypothetical protein VKB19_04035, partial [Pedobacter sp.]|nr:hypothetical protein [Pedobacter sp.]
APTPALVTQPPLAEPVKSHAPAIETPVARESAPAVSLPPPTAKIALTPITGNKQVSTLIPSLTDLERVATGDDEKEPKYITGDAKEPFTAEQLMALWTQYANKAKEDNKINVYTLLSSSEPILEADDVILVHVEHKIQEALLQEEMIDFMNFLRPALKNFNISVKTKQVVKAVVNRLYTSTERYQYLVEKNPKLEDMRRKFNLDVNS